MFRTTTRENISEASQPLLAEENESRGLIFEADDDDSDSEDLPLATGHNVRFREDVTVIGPPLRSTQLSREAEFELDSDDLDDSPTETSRPLSLNSAQRMPLLVGLFDTAESRRGHDGSAIPLYTENQANEELDLDEIAAKMTAGGSLIDSVANMANSILGAGIIGLPYAVSQAGFFTGILLLIVLCGVTDWTIRLIVVNAKLSSRTSYISIMDHCFGSSGRAAVSFFQFAFAFGGMCAFGIIIGDTIPHVIRSIFPNLKDVAVLSVFTKRQFIIALCTTCVSFPLSLYRDIHKLARASGLALVGMVIIVVSVLIEGPQVSPDLKGDPSKRYSVIGGGVFPAIGVISFAFVCHHNSLLIYGSLRTPTIDRFARVTHIATIFSLLSCTTLAVSAFLVFTDKTQGNILNNFARNDTLINVARFCFGLNMFTTLPLELFVCREVLEQYFFSHEVFSMQRHVFFTAVILYASMCVSLITCDLGIMLEITGGVSATALAYIFPAVCYLKLTDSKKPWYSKTKLPAYLCAAFGVVVLVISLFLALAKSWTPEGNPRICL